MDHGSADLRVSIRGVAKKFRSRRGEVTALDDINLDVALNERVVLLGPSGCGKTTLLRCVAGLERPDEGEIKIGGTIVYSSSRGVFVPPEQRGISMMFQSYALWPHMTVFGNVAFPLENRGVNAAETNERVAAALKLVECAGLDGRYPSQLSGGQQQRVALARAIVANDQLILFDEPLSNVDAKVRTQLRVELVALQQRLGFSTLYVTHDQVEATAIADRIAIFDSGRIAQFGKPREIYLNPANSSVAEFVGSTNHFDATVTSVADGQIRLATIMGSLIACANTRDIGVGKAVLRFKPEHVSMAKVGNPSPGPNQFEVELETEMFLGNCTEYSALCAGQRFIIRSMSSEVFRPGERIVVGVDPCHLQVFPSL